MDFLSVASSFGILSHDAVDAYPDRQGATLGACLQVRVAVASQSGERRGSKNADLADTIGAARRLQFWGRSSSLFMSLHIVCPCSRNLGEQRAEHKSSLQLAIKTAHGFLLKDPKKNENEVALPDFSVDTLFQLTEFFVRTDACIKGSTFAASAFSLFLTSTWPSCLPSKAFWSLGAAPVETVRKFRFQTSSHFVHKNAHLVVLAVFLSVCCRCVCVCEHCGCKVGLVCGSCLRKVSVCGHRVVRHNWFLSSVFLISLNFKKSQYFSFSKKNNCTNLIMART